MLAHQIAEQPILDQIGFPNAVRAFSDRHDARLVDDLAERRQVRIVSAVRIHAL